ncbi:glycosyltransferase family 2 protein [candidate division KSB1 bacterium]|nr:glycosyltransferase family 2 protein [candidate division KSB1 bacterium]
MEALKKKNAIEVNKSDKKYLMYILITPARNEAVFIEQTIKSVIRQTVLPIKWIIVSDSSTDGTDDIVKKYMLDYNWIELIRMPDRTERHFAGKAHAFNTGYQQLRTIDYDIIGCLDADISFDSDYFDYLLEKFSQFPELGVAGTPFRQGNLQYDYRFSRKEHVSGACQLFRKTCFEAIGGYVPLKAGAVDLTAVVMARMHGWRTETFTDKYCIHHRHMGTAQSHMISAAFKSGYGDYPMGVHPLWQLFRSIYQMSKQPVVLGGMMLWLGYCWAVIRSARSPVSMEFVRFRRNEQMQWLKGYFRKLVF